MEKEIKNGGRKEMVKRQVENYIGYKVILFCSNYIYSSRLVRVTEDEAVLKESEIVYETGPFDKGKYKDAQKLYSDEWTVHLSFVESFGCLEDNRRLKEKLVKE